MMDGARNHYATTEFVRDDFQVFFRGELVLKTDRAVELREYHDGRKLAVVWYFPAAALAGLETSISAKTSFCPIKGTASYLDYREAAASIWCYREPVAGVDAIRGHCAFYRAAGFRVQRGAGQ